MQAKYQVKHAIYLSNAIKQMDDKDQSWEDLMLASETSLKQIAEKTDRVASFDTGLDNTTGEIIQDARKQRIDEPSGQSILAAIRESLHPGTG